MDQEEQLQFTDMRAKYEKNQDLPLAISSASSKKQSKIME